MSIVMAAQACCSVRGMCSLSSSSFQTTGASLVHQSNSCKLCELATMSEPPIALFNGTVETVMISDVYKSINRFFFHSTLPR